ncbi:hypothetical protein H4S08_000500 [Coemansia sp. RSA 1365]|nr:hypothetical protein H4S08_000500 [Coemansia sp. RSA 1365]
MVRGSKLLTTTFLVFWISVLGSTGSLMQGWRASPKALSPRAFELLLWSRFTRHELSSNQKSGVRILRITQGMSNPNDTDKCDAAQAWLAYFATLCPKIFRTARSRTLPRQNPRMSLGFEKASQWRSQPVCFDTSQGSRCSSKGGRVGVERPITDSTRTLEAWVNGDIPKIRPMSSLLYRRRPTPTSAAALLDTETQKTELYTTASPVAPAPRLGYMSFGQCMHYRPENNSVLQAPNPISRAHWLSEPCSDFQHTSDSLGAQYRKRALALRRASGQASRTLVAPEELTASAILPEEPNGVTSMIAISTVLVFATLGAF